MIHIDGREELLRGGTRMREIRSELSKFRDLHNEVGKSLLDWVRRNFSSEGRLLVDFPTGWPPLASSTLLSRRRRGKSFKLLHDSGALRGGFTLAVNERRAVLNNPVQYAPRHHLGQGLPRRPIFPGKAQAEKLVLPIAHKHIEKILK